MVREAIQGNEFLGPKLPGREIGIYVYGSYKNKTNLRAHSDIDLYVCWRGNRFRKDRRSAHEKLKDELEKALAVYFDDDRVQRRNKAIGLPRTKHRLGADVLACLEYRRSRGTAGIELWSDAGEHIVSWPWHHLNNGRAKDEATGRRFKPLVKALKGLRHELVEEKHWAALRTPSYLVECLVWNVPANLLRSESRLDNLRKVLAYLRRGTVEGNGWRRWKEVHCKDLLDHSPRWNDQIVTGFLDAAQRRVFG